MATTVVYADISDGHIESFNGVYATARAGGTFAVDAAGAGAVVGQLPSHYIYEAFLGFDTSPIPDTDAVSAAILRVTADADYSVTDFIMQARLRDWGATLEAADFVPGANLAALTLLATHDTAAGFVSGTGYDLVDVAMPANVNKTGFTRMVVCSSRTTDNIVPTGNEFVIYLSANSAGTTSDPVLTVTHAAAGTAVSGADTGAGTDAAAGIGLAGTDAGTGTEIASRVGHVIGTTKSSTGAVLGDCVVKLYRTSNDALVGQTVSAADGGYDITTSTVGVTYYIVAYRAGSPDVAGTSVNTLV